MQKNISRIVFFLSSVFLMACSSNKKLANGEKAVSISSIKFLSEYAVPYDLRFQGTVVGGLSGIDYNKNLDEYYMICDDPSAVSPARYYTAKISITNNAIDSVAFTNVTTLLNKDGKPYADIIKDRLHSADLEALRFIPLTNEMIYSTEGQRHTTKNGSIEIQQPSIIVMDKNGNYKDSFALPANMYFHTTENGPRHNSVFEGLDFTNHYKSLFLNVEESLYEDGLRAGLGDSTAWVRFLKFNTKTKKQVAQYAYQIDAVPFAPIPADAFKINGISDIMFIGNNKFLVIERGYSKGRKPSDIRIYIADISQAENIANNPSLKEHPVKKPITKKLLLDFNSLGRFVDNVEGVTFGPILPNGKRSLVFVVDNNFDKIQISQFWLFEINE